MLIALRATPLFKISRALQLDALSHKNGEKVPDFGGKNKNNQKMKTYVKESFRELVSKVTWPTWKSLQSSAILVMVASLIFAIVIMAMDFSFETIMKNIYSLLY